MEKISAVYKIVNTVTGDFYIGSSKNVYHRWVSHKSPSRWNKYPNNPMYQDFQKYGVDKFRFQILIPVMPEYLKQVEQECIEMLKPTYNKNRAKGWDVERQKEANRKYQQSEKGKEAKRKYQQSERGKEANRKYQQSEKGKEAIMKANRKRLSRPCVYEGRKMTFGSLYLKFRNMGIENASQEAKKYLL